MTNQRGHGLRLREEILQAAERLLSEGLAREGVSLRSIAREAGIAAPSIYAHFPDRDAVLDVVVERAYHALRRECAAAADAAAPGRPRIEALCRSYLRFAQENPGRYRVLFHRARADLASPPHPYVEGIAAFGLLEDALGPNSTARAQLLWLTLHGLAMLPAATPGFPWEPETVLIEMLLDVMT